jgi:hypothetical protein
VGGCHMEVAGSDLAGWLAELDLEYSSIGPYPVCGLPFWRRSSFLVPGPVVGIADAGLIIGPDPLINIPDLSKSPVIVQGPIICILDWFKPPLTGPGHIWRYPWLVWISNIMTVFMSEFPKLWSVTTTVLFTPSFKEIVVMCCIFVSHCHCSFYAYWSVFLV